MTLAGTPFFRNRWPLFLIILVFIVCKWPHLSYPFYWDECWPYAAGIRRFYENGGPSLFPAALDPEFSRGHPLFFHSGAVIWMHLFGTSNAALHSWPLFLSVLFLFVIYEAGLRLFNQRVAVLATLLTATQVMFFVQSSFVLTDLPVAFFSFAALWLYASEKYVTAALLFTLAFFTKESALFAGVVAGIDAAICLFNTRKPVRRRIAAFMSVLVPALLIVLFFVVQKYQHGWYIFPKHEGMIETGLPPVLEKLRAGFSVVFRNDHKSWIYGALILFSVVTMIVRRTAAYLIPVVAALMLAVFAAYFRKMEPAWLPLVVFIAAFGLLIYWPFRCVSWKRSPSGKMVYLMPACCLSFMLLSALNFYSDRYFMLPLVLMLFFTAIWIDRLSSEWHSRAWLAFLPLILVAGFFGFKNSTGTGDTQLGAFKGMQVQQKLVDYMEGRKAYDSSVAVGGYLDAMHLRDHHTGFLGTQKEFSDVRWEIDKKTRFVIFTSIEEDSRYEDVKRHKSFEKVFRYEATPQLWTEVFERVR